MGRCYNGTYNKTKGKIKVPAAIRSTIKLFIGMLIFIGIPVVMWGVYDIQGFFAHPARVGYVIVVVLVQIVTVIKIPDAGSDRGRDKDAPLRQKLTLLFLQLVPLGIMIAAPYSDGHHFAVLGDIDILRYVGLILFTVGFTIMLWAEMALGKLFSIDVVIQEGHRLITDGLYRYIRHPRYLGIILFATGVSLIFASWIGLMLVIILMVALSVRIYDEEIMLYRQFGVEWESYRKRSWKLIPFVY